MTRQAVFDFLAHEAWLLNTGDWNAWNALFADGGAYWMPAKASQTSPKDHVSLIYDTPALRAARIKRLEEKDGLSVETGVRSIRNVSGLIAQEDPNGSGADWHARGAVMMAEYHRGTTNTFHATVQWHLQASDSGFVIVLKRVDLINADGVLSDILTYV